MVSVVLSLVCAVVPAGAATRSRVDSAPDDEQVTARYDLTRVTWDYTSEWLVVTARMATARKEGVVLDSRSAHDWEGYEVEARTWWQRGRKVDRLWIWYSTDVRTRIDCPGLRSRWKLGDEGLIRLSVPNTCLFEGYPMRDLLVMTHQPGAAAWTDRVASAARLTSR